MFRLFALAASIGAAMVGGLYVIAGSARAELPPAAATAIVDDDAEPEFDLLVVGRPEANDEEVIDAETGLRMGPLSVRPSTADANVDEIIDPETGLRMGPLTVRRVAVATDPETAEPETDEAGDAEPAVERTTERSATRRVARTPAPTIPRLHPDPGRHVILTARAMTNEPFRGSCYAYLSEVFSRADHAGWRTRTIVHRSGTAGPYANLDAIRPGDWLYIVNHPESTPVGTHSVLFVGWEDRASGYARVIEHPGWGEARTGQERGYDVSRTYRIVRPIMAH